MASTAFSKAVMPLVKTKDPDRRAAIRRIYSVPLSRRKDIRYQAGVDMTAKRQKKGHWL